MMKAEGFGLQMWGAISRAVMDLISFQYVDDATISHSGPSNDTPGETILALMQVVIDHWEGALRTSGGAIAHDKSYWHLIDFRWTGRQWVYRKASDIPGTLTVTGPDGFPVDIERLEASQSKEMLGLMGRPDGNGSDEAGHLLSKTTTWADSLREFKIKPSDSWYSLNSTVMRTVEYPLMATTLTKKELDTIMAPVIKYGLRSSSIQRNMPKALVYSPIDMQGLNIHHPFYTKLSQHLLATLRDGTRKTISGHLLRSGMEQLTLELGTGTSFWQLPPDPWAAIMTPCWLKSTWVDLSSSNLSLEGPISKLELLRDGDQLFHPSRLLRGRPSTSQLHTDASPGYSRLQHCHS
jgi:hypothetical protein